VDVGLYSCCANRLIRHRSGQSILANPSTVALIGVLRIPIETQRHSGFLKHRDTESTERGRTRERKDEGEEGRGRGRTRERKDEGEEG